MGYTSYFSKFSQSSFLSTRIVYCIDVLASLLASYTVLMLLGILMPTANLIHSQSLIWLGSSVAISAIVFRIGKAYRAIIRYTTIRELGKIGVVCLSKDILLWLCMAAFSSLGYSSELLAVLVLLDFFATICALVILRIAMILIYDRLRIKAEREADLVHVLIYGINDKSVSTQIRLGNSTHYSVDGFITYAPELELHEIAGKRVFSFRSEKDLEELHTRYGIDGILFPYIQEARAEKERLIEYCNSAGIKTFVVPSVDELNAGASLGTYVRKVRVEDLLGRKEIEISMGEIMANLHGKTVMVTGAAGSIGSELCRQLATFGVKNLVLFDNAETPLHNIRLELEDKHPNLNFVPVIGDVRSDKRLDFVFKLYHPQIVFHAAAYKHVPLMEENPCEAVMVNVIGSRQVADKCVEYGVEKMVMISTDKAVNPTNIMGCTKRLAEIYVQSLGLAIERGEIKGHTQFITTRFGNVLGSNGSVIPRFREQIENGGPITVTHPEIRRFFMTIPEACRLVMEAATFASGTQIFVFDMGESVKIATLAERMVTLAGLEPGRDIQIVFTGLRPGEKLYEEVLANKENTIPTEHERIFVAKVREYDFESAVTVCNSLREYASSGTIPDMVILMKQTVPEFKSKHSEFEKYDK